MWGWRGKEKPVSSCSGAGVEDEVLVRWFGIEFMAVREGEGAVVGFRMAVEY